MSRAVFDPDARSELLSAVAYYKEREEGLGHRFRRAVENAVEDICEMPLRILGYPPTLS